MGYETRRRGRGRERGRTARRKNKKRRQKIVHYIRAADIVSTIITTPILLSPSSPLTGVINKCEHRK